MGAQETISESFTQLVKEGQRLGDRGTNVDYLRFRARAMNLIRRSCGSDSDHYQELKRIADGKDSGTNPYYFEHCVGVVEAAQLDWEAGLLFNLRSLIAAELLGDFLTQAEALLAAGYHVPAASLAGAVLEDALRTLCEKHAVSYSSKSTINTLNAELARHGVYDKLVLKRITAIADVRNNADHGQFDAFSREDVVDMVKWIGRFTADCLGERTSRDSGQGP